ncbi:MAG TPA: VOC family protein [Actinoplanes sp.]|nr:VOC family protein [Actinoplanes sp.]
MPAPDRPSLELDHLVCLVDDLDAPSRTLQRAGWVLDSGTIHIGQGTRNRRLAWPEHHLELLCVTDEDEAGTSPLRFDRRARWRSTGASPFGVGLRGTLTPAEQDDFWLYEEAGARIWIHHDNERAPHRPMLFVIAAQGAAMTRRRPGSGPAALPAHRPGGLLTQVLLSGTEPAPLPPYTGPPIIQRVGVAHLDLIVDTGQQPLPITPILTLGPPRAAATPEPPGG